MTPTAAIAAAPVTWHVLGAGAIGCLWAGALASAGNNVRMIARAAPVDETHAELQVSSGAGTRSFGVLFERQGDHAPVAHLLVCTKAFDLPAAVASLAPRLQRDGTVVLLQNGLGFQDAVRAALQPQTRLYVAASTEGAWREGPLAVHHAGRGETLLGSWPPGDTAGAVHVAAMLGRGGLAVSAVEDMVPVLWRKLAVNCAINPLTALYRCPNGALLDAPALRIEFDALVAELEQVFAALGHGELAAVLRAEASRVARATAANRSSMLQDIEAGRRTEVEYITGFLCRAAHAAGIACPRNEALLTSIRALERR